MLQTVPAQAELQVIQSDEERAITEWQQLYPDRWLLLHVTQEDEGEPRTARLVAVAPDDMTLVPLWQEQTQQGKITALVYGHSPPSGPSVVA